MLNPEALVTHCNGCHGARVRIEVKLPQGADAPGTYTFDAGRTQNYSCLHCGVKSFCVSRAIPTVTIYTACRLDPGTVRAMSVRPVDGRHWKQVFPAGRAARFPHDPRNGTRALMLPWRSRRRQF